MSYSKFHSWSQPYAKKYLSFKLPDPSLLLPWKSKASLVIAYIYAILSLCVLAGIRQGPAYALLILHLIYTVLYDNPALTHTVGTYETKVRSCLFDAVIAGALIMIASWTEDEAEVEKVPQAGSKKEVSDKAVKN